MYSKWYYLCDDIIINYCTSNISDERCKCYNTMNALSEAAINGDIDPVYAHPSLITECTGTNNLLTSEIYNKQIADINWVECNVIANQIIVDNGGTIRQDCDLEVDIISNETNSYSNETNSYSNEPNDESNISFSSLSVSNETHQIYIALGIVLCILILLLIIRIIRKSKKK